MEKNFTTRTGLIIGDEGINKLKNSNVIVFGVGGVGSFAAEAIAFPNACIPFIFNVSFCPNNVKTTTNPVTTAPKVNIGFIAAAPMDASLLNDLTRLFIDPSILPTDDNPLNPEKTYVSALPDELLDDFFLAY